MAMNKQQLREYRKLWMRRKRATFPRGKKRCGMWEHVLILGVKVRVQGGRL